ncbi:S-layer homology domain-containing protein [Saccharibacillus deserti]|uniref:S-layer homology domain-containing protein n=1 Tax=Saccharibacillus deserti TaxID=1634444 RepID=UPI0015571881|nr:S-layer homology domain-containing protein [Saccharibacillus deserti]
MKKKIISAALAFLLVMGNAPFASALSPVAEVYYNTGTSKFDSAEFDSQLNDAVRLKLSQQNINPKYVSIMDASADRMSVTDTTYVHSGYDSWYIGGPYATTPQVETADYNHVQMSNNGSNFTFYGYTSPGYKDFMLTSGSPTGKKIITFDMDESKVDYHSMEGGGFLFNTKIDAERKLSGYVILYVQGAVNVYKIDGLDVDVLHNETSSYLADMPGVSLLQSYSKGSSPQHSIKIVATDATLNMWDNGEPLIRNLSLPNQYGNEFGPIVSYGSHGCEIISVFSFENMKLYSTSSKTLDVAVNKIPWGNAPLRYVVNLNDNPSVELDGGTKQAELKDAFDGKEAQYLGVTDVVYKPIDQAFIDSIKKGGLHVDVNEGGPEVIDALADKIVEQLINGYKEPIEAIEQAEAVTDIQYSDYDSKNSVNGNLTLLSDKNVTTVWSSDQPSVIDANGVVKRPVISQKGMYVNLTATITQGGLTSEKTFAVYVNAAEPAPLSDLSVVAGNGQAVLNFPALTGATKITIEQSSDGEDYVPVDLPEPLDASSTSATVTGLTNGEKYFFRLNVESGPYAGHSNAVETFPSQALTTLEAIASSEQTILNFPALTGASSITVEQSEDGKVFAPVDLAEPLDSTSTSATISGLTDGKTYFFRLKVQSGKYAGVSNTVEVSPSNPVSTLTAEAGQEQVTLKFPAVTGASDIVIELSTNGTDFTPVTLPAPLDETSTSVTLPNLSSNETYHFRLVVKSGPYAGTSNVVTIKPDAAPPVVTEPTPPVVTEPTPPVVTEPTPPVVETTPSVSNPPVVVQQPAPTMKTEVIVTDPSKGGQSVQEKITKLVGSDLKVAGKIKSADGKELNMPSLEMKADGTFVLPQVAPGEYTLALNVIAPNGDKLAGPSGMLNVDSQGNAKMSVELIDPYGTILDSVTGKPVPGVNMKLYWADTELNRSKGRVPGTQVNLPELADFAPNQNHNPQSSTDEGQYGWMVFADGDYYFMGEKNGYNVFDSRTDKRDEKFGSDSYIKDGLIHVGQTIVKFDFSMQAKVKAAGDHAAYMVGYPDGTFRTERGINRAEVAAILSRLYTSAAPASKVSFKDVDAKNWAAKAIKTASDNKWMVGFSNRTFQPKKQVTRAEFAQTLTNLYDWDAASKSSYTDLSGHWSEKAVAALEQQGLLFDFEGQKFEPNRPITRLEVVRILNRVLERSPWEIKAQQKWSDVPTTHEHYSDIMEASVSHEFEQLETGIENWKN